MIGLLNSKLEKINQFKKTLFALEKEYVNNSVIPTHMIVSAVSAFKEFYRNLELKGSRSFWDEYTSSLTNILLKWAHSNSDVSESELKYLLENKCILTSMYMAGFDTRQRLLKEYYDPANNFAQNLTKTLLLISLNNLNSKLFVSYQNATDNVAFHLAVSWLSERCITTKSGKIYHQKLIDSFHRFRGVKVDPEFFNWVAKAYMYTTYSNSVGKDSIKQIFHELIRRELYQSAEKNALSFSHEKVTKRPRLVIVHEFFSDEHVMMRIYEETFKSLEAEFDVYNLSFSDEPCSKVEKRLAKVIKAEPNLTNIIGKLKQISPDIIFYPSIGMHAIVIALSSLRIAPIQLQGFGHPSSSHSPVIDGSIHGSSEFNRSGKEKYFTYEGYKCGIHLPFTLKKIPISSKNGCELMELQKINIGINAKVMKLCPDFIEFLKSIDWGKNAVLNFFPAETGTEYLICQKLLNAQFPNAIIHQMENYENFMKQLSEQNLAICPFPFGNTNGILDSMFLGLPTFALKGFEVCSSSEFQLLNTIGASFCTFNTKTEMVSAIERFVHQQKYREGIVADFKRLSQDYIKRNDRKKAQCYEAENFTKWIKQHVIDYEKFCADDKKITQIKTNSMRADTSV